MAVESCPSPLLWMGCEQAESPVPVKKKKPEALKRGSEVAGSWQAEPTKPVKESKKEPAKPSKPSKPAESSAKGKVEVRGPDPWPQWLSRRLRRWRRRRRRWWNRRRPRRRSRRLV